MSADVPERVKSLRKYFDSGNTLDVKTRRDYLIKLKNAIKLAADEIHAALAFDLGKSATESYMCETGLVLSELGFAIGHIKKFARAKKVRTPIAHFPAKSFTLPCPYGTVLIMSPWNYPFLLSVDPLVAAVAAGNTAALKLSSYSPNVNAVIKKIVGGVFPSGYVEVFDGGKEINSALLAEKFDYIFFTGSRRVGGIVYARAAETLTPATLELGGKSPCIVDGTADIPLAARRIVWGKFLNCGQTCVAPDYVLCDKKIHEKLVKELEREIRAQFGDEPLKSDSYGKIINRKHFDRLLSLIDSGKVACGGGFDETALKIEPTVLDNATFDDAVMQEEIFGPLLPVIVYDDIDEAHSHVAISPAPLALYIFSRDRKIIDKFTRTLPFGGGCVNDTVIHLASPYLPFGGFGDSGMGAYHGRAGFDTFTHYKSIVKKGKCDLPVRYQPFTKGKDRFIHRFLH